MKRKETRINREAELSRSRAAGMASATAGRARTFRDRTQDDDGGEAEIREGLEARRVAEAKDAQEAEDWAEWDANRRASEPTPEEAADEDHHDDWW